MRQRVLRRNGYYVVLTRIGKPHRSPKYGRWEVEVTNPKGRTCLRYTRSLARAVIFMWRASAAPVRRG